MHHRSTLALAAAVGLTVACGGKVEEDPSAGSFHFPLTQFADSVDVGKASWGDLALVIVGTKTTEEGTSEVWASMRGDMVEVQSTAVGHAASSTTRTRADASEFHALLAACAVGDSVCRPSDDPELNARWHGYDWSVMLGNVAHGFFGEDERVAIVFLPVIEDATE